MKANKLLLLVPLLVTGCNQKETKKSFSIDAIYYAYACNGWHSPSNKPVFKLGRIEDENGIYYVEIPHDIPRTTYLFKKTDFIGIYTLEESNILVSNYGWEFVGTFEF